MNGFTSYKGRSIEEGQQVRVYKNLHNGLWSIQCAKTKLVLGYASEITLKGCTQRHTFKVYETTRQLVVKEKRKKVHAYVIGTVIDFTYSELDTSIYYNPFTCKQFISGTKDVYKADKVSMLASKSKVTASNVR